MSTDPEVNIEFESSDISGDREKLTHLRYNEASEMLGIWMALDGNRKKLVTELKSKAIAWGEMIRQGNSSRKEAWIAL